MEIITPKTPCIIFGIKPAVAATNPACTEEPFTVASMKISKRKYPTTITASPVIPEIITGAGLVFEEITFFIKTKTKYPTNAVSALMIKVAGT